MRSVLARVPPEMKPAAASSAAPALLSELRAQELPAALIGEVIQGGSGHVDVHQDRSA